MPDSTIAFAGIFEGHHDPAVAIVCSGRIVAYAEEERFVRQKHAPRAYPMLALRSCLERSHFLPQDVQAIAVNWDVDAYTDGRMAAFFEQLNQAWSVDEATQQWQRYVLSNFNAARVGLRHAMHWRRSLRGYPGAAGVPSSTPLRSRIARIPAVAVRQSRVHHGRRVWATTIAQCYGIARATRSGRSGRSAYHIRWAGLTLRSQSTLVSVRTTGSTR